MNQRPRLPRTPSSRAVASLIVSIVVAIGGLVVLLGGTAQAGGWAVSTLEPLTSSPTAGRDFLVEFTIRQHGQTPVSLDGAGIAIRRSGGIDRAYFPATEDASRVGFYRATVRFPAEGTWDWQVEQGWFAPQELGAIQVEVGQVGDSTTERAPAGGGGAPLAVRMVLLVATVTAAAWTTARFARTRRHRTAAGGPTPSVG